MATLTADGLNASNGTLNGQYTGSSATITTLPIGSFVLVGGGQGSTNGIFSTPALNNSRTVFVTTGGTFGSSPFGYVMGGSGNMPTAALSGTWVRRGSAAVELCCNSNYAYGPHLFQRLA